MAGIGHPRTLWLIRHAESAGNVANAAALAGGHRPVGFLAGEVADELPYALAALRGA